MSLTARARVEDRRRVADLVAEEGEDVVAARAHISIATLKSYLNGARVRAATRFAIHVVALST